MATYGAKYPKFAPISSEPENALPTYDGAKAATIGRLVKADLTVNLASGKIFADDELAESADEFSSGTIAMETDDMEDEVASTVYGATVQNSEVHYKAGDTPPLGGLAYYKALMRRGVKYFKGYFYPRVKAALGNDSAATKTDSITFGTTATTFTIFRCKSDDWRIVSGNFTNEAEARAWVDERLAGAVATPEATPAGGEVTSGATVALSCATAGATIRYTTDGSVPDETSSAYSTPIAVTEAVTIRAKAFKSGLTASAVLTVDYTVAE